VVDVAVGDVDRGEVAVVQGDPAGQRLGLGGGGEGVDQDGVVLTKDQGRCHRIPAIGGPDGRGRSPTTAFSGAVNTLTLSGAVMPVTSSPAAKP
jgi:hypothetical protein